jgi:heme-degrading monooxygenase HmoA
MYVIVWQFEVLPERRTEFEQLYGGQGEWAKFFQQFDGFAGTELLRDMHHHGRYLTIDRWQSRDAYEVMLQDAPDRYRELDLRGDELTRHETRLGAFEQAGEE